MTDDGQRFTEEFAWVHQAYTALPAAAPEAIERAVATTMVAVSSTVSAHTSTAKAKVRRLGGRMPWVRWSPWIALIAAFCIVIMLGERWRRTDLARRQAIAAALSDTRLFSATISPPLSPHRTRASMGVDATPQGATASPQLLAPSQTPPMASSRSPSYERAVDGLDAASVTVVIRLLDSAQTRGLPIEGIVARIHEGVHRRAPSQQIILVARNYVVSLDSARTALGASATVAELQAGAEALLAGTPPGALKQLRAARPAGSLVESLVALADLSTHGVAPLQASTALAALIARTGSDTQVRALRTSVIGDIIRGVLPNAALAYRTRQSGSHTLQPVGDGADSMPIPSRSP